MDCISPIQQRHLRGLLSPCLAWRQRQQDKVEWQAHTEPSARRALVWLIAANVPLYSYSCLAQRHARLAAFQDFEQTFGARWIAHYFPDTRQQALTNHITSYTAAARTNFQHTWGLSAATPREGKWWVWLTAGFTHDRIDHLLGNMVSLYGLGDICTRIPGMTAGHMWSIALGSAFVSTFVSYLQLSASGELGWVGYGASGVVYAFGAIASLAEPSKEVQLNVGPFRINAEILVYAFQSLLLNDYISWRVPPTRKSISESMRDRNLGHNVVIDHAAHIGGALFGAFYYGLILKPAVRRLRKTTVQSEEQASPDEEQTRSLQIPEAPVDWLIPEEDSASSPRGDSTDREVDKDYDLLSDAGRPENAQPVVQSEATGRRSFSESIDRLTRHEQFMSMSKNGEFAGSMH